MLRGSLVELCWAAFLYFCFRDAFLACLGCFLGLLRTLWESLGPSLGVSWASLGDLGSLLGLLGLVGPLLGCSFGLSSALLDSLGLLLGCSWASLFEPLGPKGGQAATRCPKTARKVAQETPKGAKTVPPKCKFRVFFGVLFLTLFGTPFRKGSWTPGPLKSAISLGRSFKNAASPQVTSKSKKRQKK